MKSGHHTRWLLAGFAFGAVALPFLVYMTGVELLGPYGGGGPGAFYADFAADLARLRPAAWTLLLGPAGLILVWRMLAAYAWSDEKQ